MLQGPLSVYLDILPVNILKEAAGPCMDIEIPPGVAVLVKHDLNYAPANVDERWAASLNMMTRNLRGYTVKAMKDGNIRGKIDDDQTQSVFHLHEIDPTPGDPLAFTAYGVKEVHHLKDGTEVTDRLVNEYHVRLVADQRSELNPDGLWIAEYGERSLDGERRDQILAAVDSNSSKE